MATPIDLLRAGLVYRKSAGEFQRKADLPNAAKLKEGTFAFVRNQKTWWEVKGGQWEISPHGDNLATTTTGTNAKEGDFVKVRSDGKLDKTLGGVADSFATLNASTQLEQNVGFGTYTASAPAEADQLIFNDVSPSPDVARKATIGTILDTRKIGADAERQSAQGITASVSAEIKYGAQIWDYGGLFSAPSTDIIVSTAGIYLIIGEVEWASNSVGDREVSILRNGAKEVTVTEDAVTGGRPTDQEVVEVQELAANDRISLEVFHNSSTSPLNVTRSILEVVRLF